MGPIRSSELKISNSPTALLRHPRSGQPHGSELFMTSANPEPPPLHDEPFPRPLVDTVLQDLSNSPLDAYSRVSEHIPSELSELAGFPPRISLGVRHRRTNCSWRCLDYRAGET